MWSVSVYLHFSSLFEDKTIYQTYQLFQSFIFVLLSLETKKEAVNLRNSHALAWQSLPTDLSLISSSMFDSRCKSSSCVVNASDPPSDMLLAVVNSFLLLQCARCILREANIYTPEYETCKLATWHANLQHEASVYTTQQGLSLKLLLLLTHRLQYSSIGWGVQ